MIGADVAEYLGVSDRTVRDIENISLKPHFVRPCLRDLKAIAIDEFGILKGHNDFTIVMGLDSGAVVFAAPGMAKNAQNISQSCLSPIPSIAARLLFERQRRCTI